MRAAGKHFLWKDFVKAYKDKNIFRRYLTKALKPLSDLISQSISTYYKCLNSLRTAEAPELEQLG